MKAVRGTVFEYIYKHLYLRRHSDIQSNSKRSSNMFSLFNSNTLKYHRLSRGCRKNLKSFTSRLKMTRSPSACTQQWKSDNDFIYVDSMQASSWMKSKDYGEVSYNPIFHHTITFIEGRALTSFLFHSCCRQD